MIEITNKNGDVKKLLEVEDTGWIKIQESIFYRIINGIVYMNFIAPRIKIELKKWITVCEIPFSINVQYNFRIGNNDGWDMVLDLRITNSSVLIGTNKYENSVTPIGTISFPLN